MAAGRFIAVVGPSGVGKDSVLRALAEADPRLKVVRRVISRPEDADGEAHEAVTEAEFQSRASAGAFALHWRAHGLAYGIPVSVERQLVQGCDLLVNLSRAVLREAQARFARLVVLSLTAPQAVLADRLVRRGREEAREIAERLARCGTALPEGLTVIELDNAGPLERTVAEAQRALQRLRA